MSHSSALNSNRQIREFGGIYLRENVKHCSTCVFSYWTSGGEISRARRVQRCRHPAYLSSAYTEEMMLADSVWNHCRFWTPRPEKGKRDEKQFFDCPAQ